MITKRLLGLGFSGLGLLLILGPFAADLIRADNYQGIGPTQRIALIVGGLTLLVGLSLIPLGNRPA